MHKNARRFDKLFLGAVTSTALFFSTEVLVQAQAEEISSESSIQEGQLNSDDIEGSVEALEDVTGEVSLETADKEMVEPIDSETQEVINPEEATEEFAEPVEMTDIVEKTTEEAPTEIQTIEVQSIAEAPAAKVYSSADQRYVSNVDHVREGENVKRISGINRYANAVKISEAGYRSASTVVIANGSDETLADALTGAVISDIEKSPLLLTHKDRVSQEVIDEIKRLGAKKVIILGGELSVNSSVFNTFKNLGYQTERIAGRNRYAQAAKVAEKAMAHKEKVTPAVTKHEVFLVNGEKFADAMSVAPISASRHMPVLLTKADRLDEHVTSLLDRVNKVFIVGGERSISKSIADTLKNRNIIVERLGGRNRYEVNRNVLDKFDLPKDEVFVVSGEVLADGLNTASLAARENKGMVLVKPNNIVEVQNQLQYLYEENGIDQFIIVGGENTITPKTELWLDSPKETMLISPVVKTKDLSGKVFAIVKEGAGIGRNPHYTANYDQFANSSTYFGELFIALERATTENGISSIKLSQQNGITGWFSEDSIEEVPAGQPIHVVRHGDTLYNISLRYETTMRDIAQASGIRTDQILYTGDVLYLPRKQENYVNNFVYGAGPGETLTTIANKFETSVTSLMSANPGVSSTTILREGRVINIPSAATKPMDHSQAYDGQHVVFLDPGHGGWESGAVARTGQTEKNLNLELYRQLRQELENRGYKVLTSRTGDEAVGFVTERSNMANASNADIFLSLHNNSMPAGNYSTSGIETFYYKYAAGYPTNNNNVVHNDGRRIANSAYLTQLVHNNLIQETNAVDRGVKASSFAVLRNTDIPSVLLEYGFMSNSTENAKLHTASYQRKLTIAVANAVDTYFNSVY